MKTQYYIVLILVFLIGSCAPWKDIMVTEGNQNDAIKNAIHDFLHTSKFSKKDSIFSIYFENVNDNVLGVSIGAEENKLLPSSDNKIGTNHPYFPTRYIEQEGKLFYWYDSTHVITNDLVSILSKYNQIDSLNVNGFVGIPETSSLIDESKKGVHYYFCKNDLLKYKKVVTNKALGYYEPPKLECGSK